MTCSEWITHGFITRDGGSGHACGLPTVGIDMFGHDLCQQHYDQLLRERKRFDDEMARSTRHLGQIGTPEGVYCTCGDFVAKGDNHPFSLSSRLEDAQEKLGLMPCPSCAYRWQHSDLSVNCGGGCADGWIPIPFLKESP